MKKIFPAALLSLLVIAGVQTGYAQTTTPVPASGPVPAVQPVPATDTVPVVQPAPAADTVPVMQSAPAAEPAPVMQSVPAAEPAPVAAPAGPYRTDAAVQPAAPCVRQVRRIPPPPSPRRFRRQWPLAALGSIVGWFAADRVVGPQGSKLVILSSSTLGAIAGSHIQASREGHASLGRSVMGGLLGAFPAGAVLYMNGADVYDEAKFATRGIVPVVGGSLQAGVTAMVTSSSLQPSRIQIIECPHTLPAATVPNP
jgi:hypothetical protein